jgi:hypothetical protein
LVGVVTATMLMTSSLSSPRGERAARAVSIAAMVARAAAPSPCKPCFVVCNKKASAAVTRFSTLSSRMGAASIYCDHPDVCSALSCEVSIHSGIDTLTAARQLGQ